PGIAVACRDDLALRLDRDRVGFVVDPQNSGRHLARTAEARIERAVSIVTDKGENVTAVARCDYLAIRPDRDRIGSVEGTQKVGRYLAGAPKSRIERGVRIGTDDR